MPIFDGSYTEKHEYQKIIALVFMNGTTSIFDKDHDDFTIRVKCRIRIEHEKIVLVSILGHSIV